MIWLIPTVNFVNRAKCAIIPIRGYAKAAGTVRNVVVVQRQIATVTLAKTVDKTKTNNILMLYADSHGRRRMENLMREQRVLFKHSYSNRFVHAVFALEGEHWTLYRDSNTKPFGEAVKHEWSIAPKGKFRTGSEIEQYMRDKYWIIMEWKP